MRLPRFRDKSSMHKVSKNVDLIQKKDVVGLML